MRVYLWLVMLCATLGLFIAMVCAEEVPTARFAGSVVDAEGRPVADAQLSLAASPRSNDLPFLERDLGTTDLDGRFAVGVPQTPLPQGRSGTQPWPKHWQYRVSARKPGNGLGWARAEDEQEVAIQMSRPAALGGKVLDADGAPLVGALVGISRITMPRGQRQDSFTPPFPWASVRTDEKGEFSFADLPAGASVSLYLQHPNAPETQWGDQWPPELSDVTLAEQTTELTIRLVRTPTIAGWLLLPGARKTPAAHINIRATGRRVTDPPSNADAFWESTDESGRYRFRHLIPGLYAIWVEQGEYTGVVARDVEVKQDERLELPPVVLQHNVWIEGRVLDADTGAPIPGAGLTVTRRDVPRPGGRMVGQDGKGGPDGRFRAKAPPTRVVISAAMEEGDYQADYHVERVVVDGRTRLRVVPDKRKLSYRELSLKPGMTARGVDLYLKRCVRLTGRVVGPDGQAWVRTSVGPALPGETVYVTPDYDRVQSRMGWMPSAAILHDGTFTARDLFPGVPVVLTVFDDYTGLGGVAQVTPELDRNAEVVIRLAPAARVTGRVLMPDGTPAADASVYVRYVLAAYAETDAAGRFDFAGGIPGLPCVVSVSIRSDTDGKLLFTGTSKTVGIAPGQEVMDVGDIVLAPWKEPPPE